MTNVVSINRRKTRAEREAASNAVVFTQVRDILTTPPNHDSEMEEQSRLLHALDELSSDMLVRKLQLAHRREADIRSWTAEEEKIAAEMEAAVYLAYRRGVPEEAIYDLDDEALSDALQSAMRKVAGA